MNFVLILAIVASTWLVLALAGLPLFLHLRDDQQRLLLPALPIVGAMALVVLVHWPAAVVPTPAALGITAVILGLVAVTGWRRGGRIRVTRSHLTTLAATIAIGVVPVVLALLPVADLDRPRLVQPTLNNDAFAYVSVASWLRENPALDLPQPVVDPPVYGYVRNHLDIGLRIGEEFLQVGGALINGRDVASTWYLVLGAWLLMLPGAIWSACRLTGLSSLVGATAGFVAGTSAVVLSQVYNQNSAAALGMAMAPLAVVALARRLDGSSLLPWWFAPLALCALAGTYTEYLPMLAPGLLFFVLARHPRKLLPVIGRGALTFVVAVVASPLIWWNVVRSLLLTTGITAPGVQSSFIHAPGSAILDRVVGATWLDGLSESSIGLWLCVLLAVSFLGAFTIPDVRRIWLPVTVGAVVVIWYLTFVHKFPYGQQRAVQITVPLALLALTAGFGGVVAIVGRAIGTGRRGVAALATVPLVFAGASFPAVNISSSVRWERQFQVEARTLDAALLEGVSWIKELDRADGAETMVVNSNFFEQLWLTYELRHEEGLSYPFLYPDYMIVGRYDRWDGRLRRFALVGRDDYIDVDPGVVVRENARFRLLDFDRGEGIIATPSVNWGGGERNPEGVAHWMGDAGELLVLRTPGTSTKLIIEGNALADLDPLVVGVVTAESEAVANPTIGAGRTEFVASLPDRPGVLLFFNNAKPAQRPSSGGDPRNLSFYLTDVSRG